VSERPPEPALPASPAAEKRRKTVLVVDDDRVGRESLAEAVAEMGYRALQAADGGTALRILDQESVDLVLTDLRMPTIDGIELLGRVRRRDSRIFVILITAFATVKTAVEAMRLGAFHYIMKPIDIGQLAAHVDRAILNQHFRRGALQQREHALDRDPYLFIPRPLSTDQAYEISHKPEVVDKERKVAHRERSRSHRLPGEQQDYAGAEIDCVSKD
jgi:DNA-binding response OmpR family regulator